MKIKRNILILFVLFVFLANLNAATTLRKMLNSSNRMIKKVSARDAYGWYQAKNALFIDVDEPAEFNKLTIPGAVNIPRGVIEFRIGRYANKNTRIVIFSGRGERGILATYNLQGLGYFNVYNLDGGLNRWRNARFPVQSRKSSSAPAITKRKKILRRIK